MTVHQIWHWIVPTRFGEKNSFVNWCKVMQVKRVSLVGWLPFCTRFGEKTILWTATWWCRWSISVWWVGCLFSCAARLNDTRGILVPFSQPLSIEDDVGICLNSDQSYTWIQAVYSCLKSNWSKNKPQQKEKIFFLLLLMVFFKEKLEQFCIMLIYFLCAVVASQGYWNKCVGQPNPQIYCIRLAPVSFFWSSCCCFWSPSVLCYFSLQHLSREETNKCIFTKF